MNTSPFRLLVSSGLVSFYSFVFGEQTASPPAPTTPVASAAAAGTPAESPTPTPKRTAEELDQLLGPIALYPDALIALILPAATVPSEVVLASRYLSAQGDPDKIDEQPWDESVRALARYPELIAWMDQNLAWTNVLGDAFAAQPADVMNAIQRLRAKARAAGTLTDTAQQRVVVEDENILIVPARTEVIYVPHYDPAIVYYRQPSTFYGSFFSFGVGYSTGSWLRYDCDWRQRVIWVGPRHPHAWPDRRHWHRPVLPGRPGYVHHPHWRTWHPSPHRPIKPHFGLPGHHHHRPNYHGPRNELPRPVLPANTPSLTYRARHDEPPQRAIGPRPPSSHDSGSRSFSPRSSSSRNRSSRPEPTTTAPALSFNGSPAPVVGPQSPPSASLNRPIMPSQSSRSDWSQRRDNNRRNQESTRSRTRGQDASPSTPPAHFNARPAPSVPREPQQQLRMSPSVSRPSPSPSPESSSVSRPSSPAPQRNDPPPRPVRNERVYEREHTDR